MYQIMKSLFLFFRWILYLFYPPFFYLFLSCCLSKIEYKMFAFLGAIQGRGSIQLLLFCCRVNFIIYMSLSLFILGKKVVILMPCLFFLLILSEYFYNISTASRFIYFIICSIYIGVSRFRQTWPLRLDSPCKHVKFKLNIIRHELLVIECLEELYAEHLQSTYSDLYKARDVTIPQFSIYFLLQKNITISIFTTQKLKETLYERVL